MTFMNSWDIEEAKVRAARLHGPDSRFARAAQALETLSEWADENSDGWAYWPKPVRASRSLQDAVAWNGIVNRGDDLTEAEFRRLLQPIKAFFTRQTGFKHGWVKILGEDLP